MGRSRSRRVRAVRARRISNNGGHCRHDGRGLGRSKTGATRARAKLATAEKVLKRLDEFGDRLILTAHVVAEYLIGFDDDHQAEQLRLLAQNFYIHPFDARAAAIAAKLLTNKDLIKAVQSDLGVSRQLVKADVAIIASAISGGATLLISDEESFRRVAHGQIIVKTMEEFLADALARRPAENNPKNVPKPLFPEEDGED